VDYFEIPGLSTSTSRVRHLFRLDEQENLWEYYFTIFERLRKYINIPFEAITAEGFAFEEYPQLEAIREALVNMLMHTDYFSPAKPRIRVYDDQMEFFNPGALPKPIDQIIKEDFTMPRNPILAKLFRIVKLAENAGYGFDKMISGWSAYTTKQPHFEQGIDFTKAVFEFQEKPQHVMGWEEIKKGLVERLDIRLVENAWKVLEQIWIHPKITIKEIAKNIGTSTTTVDKHIAKLKKYKMLERIGSDKGGVWMITELEKITSKSD
jgi:ATP-dependent DNA helicase RecG